MRTAAFTELGDPDGVETVERQEPEPGDDEAIVDVRACSVNRHDLWILEGESPLVNESTLPFVSGLDVAGVVAETGDGASVDKGDRVLLCPNQTCGECEFCREGPENMCQSFMLYHGGFAESAAVDASRLIALPDDVGFTEASTLPTAYLTAWHMLRKTDVTAGDTVFVPGATGGVGVATIQLCDVVGARTVGTSTSEEKLSRLRDVGCDHTVESGDVDEIKKEVRSSVGRVDATVNHLAGEFTQLGLEVTKRGGTQAICGRTAGATSEIFAPKFFLHQQEIVGSTMGTQPELENLVRLVADGKLEPVVGATYTLEETRQAFADMDDRDAFGKLVVEPQSA
ncbi:MAG: D-arabinose 1-dehydrogenase-like Zn-dependent alcohol dehydrogenase [Methanobacteriota archaeon]|jgi:D-arabinose 1-dehydrogenase-like Zn-dependent alcohol dehydrogenase|uniref:Zinc-binding dehydrogenase n=1 Tax=Halorutilus salinus TaxID=2487751 RepID=A0A9Q4C4K9_9EURY|nr:zinc-binding dehydrogenase [Halorutilus salinus]MCX2818957.1 zinc-binding dehydrogenase [Halorutilus salinus]